LSYLANTQTKDKVWQKHYLFGGGAKISQMGCCLSQPTCTVKMLEELVQSISIF